MNAALETLNLRDMNTIIEALYISHLQLQHDDEKALLRITLNKMVDARDAQLAWLQKEYA